MWNPTNTDFGFIEEPGHTFGSAWAGSGACCGNCEKGKPCTGVPNMRRYEGHLNGQLIQLFHQFAVKVKDSPQLSSGDLEKLMRMADGIISLDEPVPSPSIADVENISNILSKSQDLNEAFTNTARVILTEASARASTPFVPSGPLCTAWPVALPEFHYECKDTGCHGMVGTVEVPGICWDMNLNTNAQAPGLLDCTCTRIDLRKLPWWVRWLIIGLLLAAILVLLAKLLGIAFLARILIPIGAVMWTE